MNKEKKAYQLPKFGKANAKGDGASRNDNWIFFTALVISLLFWALIKLSDQYTVPYTFQINYKSIPSDKRLTQLKDSTINVDVTTQGFGILELNLFENMETLDINMTNFSIMRKEGNEYFVYTEELKERLADVIGVPKANLNFSKTTLSFTLVDLAMKELPVKNPIKFTFSDQYDLYSDPVISPDKVMVYGPSEVLDTMTSIYIEKVDLKPFSNDQELHIALKNPSPELLNLEPAEAGISLRVEKFTTGSLELPIEVPRLKKDVKLFPKTVKVHFNVAQKDYNNVRPTQFEVTTNLSDVDIYSAVRLHLVLTKQPDFVRNISLDPGDVEFLIIK